MAGPLAGKPVKRLIATHYHPDHIGVAGWLVEMLKIPFWITPEEMAAARFAMGLTQETAGVAAARLYVQASMPAEAIAAAAARGPLSSIATRHR